MRQPARACALVCLLVVCSTAATDARPEYGVPVEINSWHTERTPLSHMVDVTNEFGLKVLAEHNFLNENNIAFSPYGLMGILVALYEGVEGESSYQIQRAMQLPWNRNVMRIGFRDIHRTLKIYFVPEEGFLAGLALNNENVTFNDSYKNVLRFYGFDFENDQLPSMPVNNETTQSPSSISAPSDGVGPSPAVAAQTPATTAARADLPTPHTREDTTTNPNAETFNDIDLRMPSTVPTTLISSSESNTGDTIDTVSMSTISNNVLSTLAAVQSSESETTIPSRIFQSRATTPYVNDETETTTFGNQELTTVSMLVNATIGHTTNDITDSPLISSNTQVQYVAIQTEPESTLISESSIAKDLTTPENIVSMEKTSYRQKKSIVNFIFTNPSYFDDDLMNRAFDIPAPVSTIQQTLGRNQMFLAKGLKSVKVSYMEYDSVMEHAFLPHLGAAALRLPLDSARYYLLALLPARAQSGGLTRLLGRLARRSDLRDIYAALRPTRVKALLPSFTVKGHVILTADLQKLGIRSVFEGRQRDFTPMTSARGVHARSVEQAVSVALRKYAPDHRNSSVYATQHPVHFSATYPFLYFVMDASIHVALMAGKMADPLNSRIL